MAIFASEILALRQGVPIEGHMRIRGPSRRPYSHHGNIRIRDPGLESGSRLKAIFAAGLLAEGRARISILAEGHIRIRVLAEGRICIRVPAEGYICVGVLVEGRIRIRGPG